MGQDLKTGNILNRVKTGARLTEEEALWLWEHASPGELGSAAWDLTFQKHSRFVSYNRNIHIEPTNICVFRCRFCSFSRSEGHPEAWDMPESELRERVAEAKEQGVTEIHIVGGVHPDRDVHYYAAMLRMIKTIAPNVHIKAFTAIELNFMITKAGLKLSDGLKLLKEAGLDSVPGGGAELFSERIRHVICPEKGSGSLWLRVHEEAHRAGIPTNATMLYGHIETPADLVNHLALLRDLQDRTGMFNCFIPLKYRNYNNLLSENPEKPWLYDLRVFALSRLFLDNITHLKAYWPMLGKKLAALLLSYGANDFDGTIADSTRIYSMAGAEEQKPSMTVAEIESLIRHEGYIPAERDSLYRYL